MKFSLSVIGSVVALPLMANESWESKDLYPAFHAEGAAVGDLNGDGVIDLAYGPFLFAGPDFEKPQRYRAGEPFVAEKGYSDSFFGFVRDFNKDGKNDLLFFGFPGKEAKMYLNPGDDSMWPEFVVADQVANESPHFVDLIPGGFPEIVCGRSGSYGYFEAGSDPTKAWKWTPISLPGEAPTPFGHGLGVGDLNGDGRFDVIEKTHWYEQGDKPGGLWTKHVWAKQSYGGGGAQILVHDFDGDGDSDIVTSFNAHGYGLAWFEQMEPGDFSRHDLMGSQSTESPYGMAFSQLHALELSDVDGDGRKDFVTGKRYLAHQGKDVGGLQAPVLCWFRNTAAEGGGVEFVPHLIHEDSGVGVEVKVADLNADGKVDVITSNKMGLKVHLQKADSRHAAVPKWKVDDGRPQDGYGSKLSPQDALGRMEVPEGFSVDLISAEPDVTQPIAMCFDARGRIWVVEGHTYPVRAPDGQGQDRILILEDRDKDGSFETRKVFAEGINLASGIEVGFGGVYVGAAPYLMFYADKDQDDIPDGEPEILLDGWGYEDTHETLNAFTWGPDGWLYGCHGVFTHSKVGKPGTPDAEREPLNAGVWRFHPETRKFEVFAHGTSNPWGVDFNEVGDWFVSSCVIPHFFHLSQGGRYFRQAGQHFNRYTFEDIPTIADHAHFTGSISEHAFWGDNFTERRPAPTDTSSLGGGHAHCGLALYQADEFPEEYRNAAFVHNLHGHRMVREKIEKDGSGYIVRHRPDFILTNNHDFIGVGLMQGPDGALYFSDWVDPQTCHHRDVEIWDRSNGRIFRVRHGEVKTTTIDLPDRSDAELVAALVDGNAVVARQAQRILQERKSLGKLDSLVVAKALTEMESAHRGELPLRLRALWTRHVCGLLTEEILASHLDDPNEYYRSWAIQLLGENGKALASGTLTKLERLAREEFSLVTRRYLASLLQRLPHEQRWEIAKGLIGHDRSSDDRNLSLLCWYGIEPLVETDPEQALALVNVTPWGQLKEFITRRATLFPEGRAAMMTALTATRSDSDFQQLAGQLLKSLENLPSVEVPNNWDAIKKHARSLKGNQGAVNGVLSQLGARFGDTEFFPAWRAIAEDGKQPADKRVNAMKLLIAGEDPGLETLARELLQVRSMQAVALEALRQFPGVETANTLVERLPQFSLPLRNEAINQMATRKETALVLLKAVDQDQLPASLISPVMLDQFGRFKDKAIDELIDRHWTRGGTGVDLAQLSATIKEWEKKLNKDVLSKANSSRGRQVFTETCGSCHQLFGEGIALGPDLTGSNRADMGYLLENVLAPSAVVGKDYLLNVFTLKDGSTVSGMIKEETPEFLKVAMPGGGETNLKAADIKERKEFPQSLMPAGLFEALPLDQVADLVKYLASPKQVSMPGKKKPVAMSSVLPPAKGVVRIEGESLVSKVTVKKGEVRDQGMAAFGPGWSGNNHLWWTEAGPGDILTLKLEGLDPGTKTLTLFPTTAPDYAKVKIAINGQLQEADLYSEGVLPGESLRFEKVNVSPGEPLQIDIHIIGKNEAALARYMVGFDRFEIEVAK
jgi:putative membrane-bound dehydrogenase-like protein